MRELRRADLTEEVADVQGELRRLEPVEDAIAVTPLAHQIRGLQDREVARDGRARDVESAGDRAGRELAVLQFLEDLTARRIGQSAEDAGGVLHSFAT